MQQTSEFHDGSTVLAVAGHEKTLSGYGTAPIGNVTTISVYLLHFHLQFSPLDRSTSDAPQSYAHHTRWDPPFHFFILPVFVLAVLAAIVHLFMHFHHPPLHGALMG